eukprot:12051534-Karenia_brevis.AAC.1
MIQHSFTPGVAQPKARSRESAAMRDTARMIKASSPGALPGAVAHRRYPDIPVYSVPAYEERQAHLRASRERENFERFEDQNR